MSVPSCSLRRHSSSASAAPKSAITRGSHSAASRRPVAPSSHSSAETEPRSPSIPDFLRHLSKIHSNPSLIADQRRLLNQLHSAYHSDPTSRPYLTRGHVSLLLKAAKTCQHASIASWLLHTFYPPPPSPPASPPGPWPRDLETAFHIVASSVDGKHAPASEQVLTQLLVLQSQHGYPVLPSQLTPALLFYRHYEAWSPMLALHSHCLSHHVPIPCAAYPLVLIALNHTRQWQTALSVVSHAESSLLPFTPPDRLYPVYHAAIDCAGTSHQPDAALLLYARMQAIGLPARVETYTALINALAKASATPTDADLAQVRRLHAEVDAAGLAVTQPLYRGLIRAYLRCAAEEDASRLMQRFVQVHHDAASHFFVLAVCVDFDNVDAALALLEKVAERREERPDDSAEKRRKRAEWTPFVPVYNRALELCVRLRRWQAVKRVWDLRWPLCVEPNLQSLYLVAQALKPESASWQSLLEQAMPLLAQATPTLRVRAGEDRAELVVGKEMSENQAVAALWWALKAVQVGYEGWEGKELRVEVGEGRKDVVDRVVRQLGVQGEEWVGGGRAVRWSRQALQRWKDSGSAAPATAQQAEVKAASGSVQPAVVTPSAAAPQQVARAPATVPRAEQPWPQPAEQQDRRREELFAFSEGEDGLVAA